MKWNDKNKLHCMAMGFDLYINDDGFLRLQRVDDPVNAGAENGIKIRHLRSDRQAMKVAKLAALLGDKIAALAVKYHNVMADVENPMKVFKAGLKAVGLPKDMFGVLTDMAHNREIEIPFNAATYLSLLMEEAEFSLQTAAVETRDSDSDEAIEYADALHYAAKCWHAAGLIMDNGILPINKE